jgi:hypothetical protein
MDPYSVLEVLDWLVISSTSREELYSACSQQLPLTPAVYVTQSNKPASCADKYDPAPATSALRPPPDPHIAIIGTSSGWTSVSSRPRYFANAAVVSFRFLRKAFSSTQFLSYSHRCIPCYFWINFNIIRFVPYLICQ